jgi:drug/metabolite transporter (DMT)-like permease
MALSAFFFSVMSLTVKIAGQRLPTMELVFVRAVVVSVLAYADIVRRGVSLRGQHSGMLLVRGLVGFGALACFYYGVVHLPLAEATVIHFTNPVFAALIAWLFLGERLRRGELLLAAVSLAGVALVVRPAGLFSAAPSLPMLPVVSALSGALLSATAYVIVRHLRGHDAMVVVFYFAGLSSLGALPFMLPDVVWPRGEEWLVLLAVGVTTFLGQVFLTLGLQRERAARATAMGYLQIVFATLWGALFFAVTPGSTTILGAIVIVGAALLLGRLRERTTPADARD